MIAFIGGGNMAEALIRGISQKGFRDIIVSEPKEERRAYLRDRFSIRTTPDNKEAVKEAEIVVLAIKPQVMEDVLTEIGGLISEEKTAVSIAAGITLGYLGSKIRTKKLVRAMPNIGALVQESMTVLSLCECFSDSDIRVVRDIFMSVGKVITLPEKYINAVTALSGSGPAFIALFLESMIEAGAGLGLDRDTASELAIQTLIGTSRLLAEGITPSKLREMVTSPGGTTEAGLRVFRERSIGSIVGEALKEAEKRAKELAR